MKQSLYPLAQYDDRVPHSAYLAHNGYILFHNTDRHFMFFQSSSYTKTELKRAYHNLTAELVKKKIKKNCKIKLILHDYKNKRNTTKIHHRYKVAVTLV